MTTFGRYCKGKKGSLPLELLVVVIVLFAFGLFIFLGKTLIDDLDADVQADPDLSAQAKSTSSTLKTRLPNVFDGGLALVFVLLWIGILIMGYMNDVSGGYFILAVILLAITIGIAMMIDNAYSDVISDEDFNDMPTYFPMTNFILDNLALIIAVMGGSLLIVLYGKMNGGAGGR